MSRNETNATQLTRTVGSLTMFDINNTLIPPPSAEMVYRKRKRTDGIEAGVHPTVKSQVTHGSLFFGTFAINGLTNKPGDSTTSETKRTRRHLRSSPSLQVINYVPSQGQSNRPCECFT